MSSKTVSLKRKAICIFLHIAKSDRPVAFYNLDVIISVGYRVKSRRGVEKGCGTALSVSRRIA